VATKNLARTIIEGGRSRWNKCERHYSHREERVATREFLVKANRLADGFDTLCVGKRGKVYKGFADKLGPPQRWLRSQVGRPWDKVRSEMVARFNPRSLAGQHIIFDHLLQSVANNHVHERGFRGRSDLYVDRHGTLRCRKLEKRRRTWPWSWSRSWPIPADVVLWLNDRRVRGEGSTLFWLVQARSCRSCAMTPRTTCCCPVVDSVVVHGPHLHYRQAQRLTPEEVKFWQSLDGRVRDQLCMPQAGTE
jgi:hypothetical protein